MHTHHGDVRKSTEVLAGKESPALIRRDYSEEVTVHGGS